MSNLKSNYLLQLHMINLYLTLLAVSLHNHHSSIKSNCLTKFKSWTFPLKYSLYKKSWLPKLLIILSLTSVFLFLFNLILLQWLCVHRVVCKGQLTVFSSFHLVSSNNWASDPCSAQLASYLTNCGTNY